MGLFDIFKKSISSTNQNTIPAFQEILIPERSEPQPPFIPTSKEQIVATGYEAYYKNGVLYNVNPRNKRVSLDEDRQTAYDAQYIVLNNVKYDLEDANSIASIVVPCYDDIKGGMPHTTFDLGYILKMRVGKEERPHLAVPLSYKTANIMMASPIAWQKKDYYRLVVQLWSIGEIAYGDYLLQELKARLPVVLADDEYRAGNKDVFRRELNMADYFNTDYLEIPHETAVCEECAPYQNRVYCISGKDNRFPKLPDFIIENKGLHCNVRYYSFIYYEGRKITKYKFNKNGDVKEVELDAIAHSNRPFIDDRSTIEKQKYLEWKEHNDKRLEREERYYDRNNWIEKYNSRYEYYQIVNKLGEKAPKSFDGYMKMKRGNTANYQKLVVLAEKQGIIINNL